MIKVNECEMNALDKRDIKLLQMILEHGSPLSQMLMAYAAKNIYIPKETVDKWEIDGTRERISGTKKDK